MNACVDCAFSKWDRNSAMICCHEKSNGHSARIMRGVFESNYQQKLYTKDRIEFCGRQGLWFKQKDE